MSKPTAREFAQARDKGESARRNGRPDTENPWAHASTEHDGILRDAFADAYWQEDHRRRR